MKILFVGNCNHYFNRKLVTELKKYNSELVIDFFSIEKPNYDSILPYDNIYDFSIPKNDLNFLLRQRGIYSWYCYRSWNKNLKNILLQKKYDYVHLQSLTIWQLGIENFHKNIILTIWGSDFLRLSSDKIKKFKPLIEHVAKITFATEEISEKFHDKFQTKKKHHIIRFGLNVFKEIDRLRADKPQRETVNITIGYNRHPAQQHLTILDEINKLDKSVVEKINLILPLTYGPYNKEYINEIKSKINQIGCTFTIYEEFLSEQQMAQLCLTSDIMIQLQTTDAFSGSMQEYMYANNIVITGKWLNYKLLRDSGVRFYEIDYIGELHNKLSTVICNYQNEKNQCKGNQSILFELSSWEANIAKWNNLYI